MTFPRFSMKRLPKVLLSLLLLLAVAAPPLAVLAAQAWAPAVYADSYYAALGDKVEALAARAEERKAVVIGGSGVAFTIDGAAVERETGLPVVNFGLYAAFGTVYMMQLALPYIGEGDIVVLAPELSPQTLSLYFGADAALRASEGKLPLLFGGRACDAPSIFAAFPSYFGAKLGFLLPEDASPPQNEGVYARTSFDEYGNMTAPREENLMPQRFAPDALPNVSPAAYSEDFLDYCNEYSRRVRVRGASLYYAFPFINRLSIADVSKEQISALERFLVEALDFPLLSSLSSRALDEGYFYDSNYHTTTDGTAAASLLFAGDLKKILRDTTPLTGKAPPPLVFEDEPSEPQERTEGIFVYRAGAGGAALVGLTEEGKRESELVLPETLGGEMLVTLAHGCFAGSEARSITAPASVASLEGGLFAGCENLRELHLRSDPRPTASEGLLEGFEGDLRVLVPAALYDSYATDYFWAPFAGILARE